jgi:hypothetical protein
LATIAFVSGARNLLWPPDLEHHSGAVSRHVEGLPYDAPVPPLRFVATVTGLNPAERRVQVSLSAVARRWDDLPLFVDRNRTPLVQNGTLRPEFADAKVEITISDWALGDTAVSYPLAHLAHSGDSTVSRQVSVSLPARVDPAQFPNDTYSLDLRFYARLPRGLTVEARDPGTALPVVAGIARDDRLGQWKLDTDTTVAGSPDSAPLYNAHIRAELGRGWSYWAFVYAISLMPAVIGLSFFIRTRRRPGATDTSAAMELAAALLALIALRQVFVPTDIVALTRLDFLLGVQLLAVCWLMAVTYIGEPPRPPTPQPRARRRRMTPRLPDGAIRPRR